MLNDLFNSQAICFLEKEKYILCLHNTIKDAIIKMVEYETGTLFIQNERNQLVGVITDKDILYYVTQKEPRFIHVNEAVYCFRDNANFEEILDTLKTINILELASTNVVCLDINCSFNKIVATLAKNKAEKIPVVSNDTIIGVITCSNILKQINSCQIKKPLK